MNAKTETTAHKLDPLLWVVIAAIVLGGVYANTIYASVTLIIRALAGVGVFAVAIAIAMQTASGKSAWNLLKEGRVEIRKGGMAYPARNNTNNTDCCRGGFSCWFVVVGFGFTAELRCSSGNRLSRRTLCQ